MRLDKKKLASRALGVGKERILFNKERLVEIKEAITKQDIRDLVASGAIFVKEVAGRKSGHKIKRRRRAGSIRRPRNHGKRPYVALVRKARAHLKRLKQDKKLTPEQVTQLRKEIRSRQIPTRTHLKERIAEVISE